MDTNDPADAGMKASQDDDSLENSETMEQAQAPEAVEYSLVLQIEKAVKERDEYLAMAQRVQADFENYRRRNKNVYSEAFDDGASAFIKTLLPVVDNLERALEVPSGDAALRTGIELVYKQLKDALEKRGVTEISCMDKKFDPAFAQAILEGLPDEGEPGAVCAILQKGYQLGNNVLRHAMVKVVSET
jgi:molecular chaperone GrpE